MLREGFHIQVWLERTYLEAEKNSEIYLLKKSKKTESKTKILSLVDKIQGNICYVWELEIRVRSVQGYIAKKDTYK